MSMFSHPATRPNFMYLFLRECSFTLFFSLTELIIFAPFIVLAQVYALNSMLAITCVQLVLSFVFGSFFGKARWLSRKGYEILICLMVGSGLSYLCQMDPLSLTFGAIISVLLVYRGIRYQKEGWLSLYTSAVFVIAGVFYFIGVPIMGRAELLHPYSIALNSLGFCTLILFFFITNRSQLLVATLANNDQAAASSLSQTVKRASRVWLIVFLAIVAAAAYFQQVKQGLVHLVRTIIVWLLGWMTSDPPAEVATPSSSPPPLQLPPAAPHEPGWFMVFLQYVQLIVGYLLGIALILGCLYLLVRKIAPALLSLLRRFLKRSWRRDKGDTAEGFTDEKEALLSLKELPALWWRQASSKLWRTSATELSWSQLPNNEERIRYLYRLLIGQAGKRGYTFKRFLTPNETGRELTFQTPLAAASVHALTTAYNQVRYGRELVSDEQLAQVLQTMDPSLRSQLK